MDISLTGSSPIFPRENKELSFLVPFLHGPKYLRVCHKAHFLIYINDIVTYIETSIRPFADDTSIYTVIETPDASAAVINSDLQKIATWSSSWLVTFNPLKTESIIFSRKRDRLIHPPLLMNIESVQNETARIVSGATKLCNIHTLLADLRWDTLACRRRKSSKNIRMHALNTLFFF